MNKYILSIFKKCHKFYTPSTKNIDYRSFSQLSYLTGSYNLYASHKVLIFDEGRNPHNPQENPRGMRKTNTLNKLSSHMTRAGSEPGPQW